MLHSRLEGLPEPQREYRFAVGRKFAFDFCWVEQKVAVEIEGGIWIQGRHNRASSIEADFRKYNLAAQLGFKVLRFSTEMVISGEAIHQVKAVIGKPAS